MAESRRNDEKEEREPIYHDGLKPIYTVEFSKEEIASEGRRPKRKVAVMIGYCGSGYSGLQVMHNVKTIESEVFGAFVAAGAISKANADEPKKVQLVRCARTDKGVHAAGNVLSLKLIIEDENIVQKINDNLPKQIRVWGIEQTVNSFSSYQQCDSRIYEYLIPTHCFLPPHPQTFLGKKLEEFAEEAEDYEKYRARQDDIKDFWDETEEKYIKPVLAAMDSGLKEQVIENIFSAMETDQEASKIVVKGKDIMEQQNLPTSDGIDSGTAGQEASVKSAIHSPLELGIRSVKAAYLQAKLAYRISPHRLERVKLVLNNYVGTKRYHNYTVRKQFNDPSCKRHIKSFVVHGEPFLIGDTEWLSLKVHGQSFMMHQIRKMVLMATMIVRCGTHEDRMQESFETPKLTIPRAPALGLLLERPIFEAYNKYGRHKGTNKRNEVEFHKYQVEIDAFKQREIYERMWKDEAELHVFANLFGGLDALRSPQLLWASSLGIKASGRSIDGAVNIDHALEEEEQPGVDDEEG